LGRGPGQGLGAQKASANLFRIANFGFRIFWFLFSIRIPQSTFRINIARPFHGIKGAS
jgi:hypothetical protein